MKAAFLVLVAATALASCARQPSQPAVTVAGGDATRGKVAIAKYGCTACHVIPGVEGPRAVVGPDLTGMAERTFIAGVTPNVPETMIKWLRDPPSVDTLTAMPMLGLSEGEARDVAAYLYTLR